jgi:hypothetical protein
MTVGSGVVAGERERGSHDLALTVGRAGMPPGMNYGLEQVRWYLSRAVGRRPDLVEQPSGII